MSLASLVGFFPDFLVGLGDLRLSFATIYFQIQKSVALDQYTALKVKLQARELSLLTNQAPMLVV